MLKRYKNSLLARATVVLAATGLMILMATSTGGGNASADTLTSSNYRLSPTVGNSFGGNIGSGDYKLTGSGGEAVIGNGSGGSYKLGAGFAAQLQHSVNLYVEPAGLMAYYPFNEGTGPTIHDATANNNDGSIIGSLSWVNGEIGKALGFDGSASYAKVSDDSSIKPTSALTVSFWLRPSNLSSTSEQTLISTTESNGYAVALTGSSSDNGCDANSLCFFVGLAGGAKVAQVPKSELTDGNWAYVVGTYDGSSVKLYLDNGPVDSADASGSINEGSAPLCIGAAAGSSSCSGQYFYGTIDDIKLYNRALDSDEISANYQAGEGGFNAGLVIPALQSGQSQTVDADIVVDADAPYSLLTRETGLLTNVSDSSSTIQSVTGTIASPEAWVEGTTKGFGFSVISGPDGVPTKWGTSNSPNYAAIPSDNATSFYTRTGYSGGAKDVVGLEYRLDVSGDQPAGRYRTNIVFTATITP